MKINEITDKNVVWKTLLNIDLDFQSEFDRIVLFSDLVLRVKHRNKFTNALLYIETFKNRAKIFLNAVPFDPNDPDIIELKQEVRTMVDDLQKIEKLLR